MGQNSSQGHAPFAFLDSGKHFQGEGGEGGQGAAKAGNGKQAPLRCQRSAMNEIANKQANKPAAGEVGGEGAVGNGVLAAVEPKAQCPSQVSADDGSGAYGQD